MSTEQEQTQAAEPANPELQPFILHFDRAYIMKVNIDKQGESDDELFAVGMRIEAVASANDALPHLMGEPSASSLCMDLWTPQMQAKYWAIKKIESSLEAKGLKVTMLGREFERSKVNKISFRPFKDQNVYVQMNVKLRDVKSADMQAICKRLKMHVNIGIFEDGKDFTERMGTLDVSLPPEPVAA